MIVFVFIPFLMLGTVLCGQPEVACPAPRSPEHGQAFLYQEGRIVKYVCEPGYVLEGSELVRCIDGKWENDNPICLEFGAEGIKDSEDIIQDALPPVPPRPLFSWGSEVEDNNDTKVNATGEEMPLSDEARVRLLMYPRRRTRVITTRYQGGRLQSITESEEDEKKGSKDEKSNSGSTTIHMKGSPSVRMTVENGHDVEVVDFPRAAVSLNDDEALRQFYWYAYQNYPYSLAEYRTGVPVALTLTESQLAWINSLHPELRDQYLKDLYLMRADETVVGEKALAALRRYEDLYPYNYVYHAPYFRRPASSITDNVASTYDYSCNTAGYPVVPAPNLSHMHVARYDSRKNNLEPHNYYLTAVYQCDPGYYMLDSRFSELYCSKGRWVGISPICVKYP